MRTIAVPKQDQVYLTWVAIFAKILNYREQLNNVFGIQVGVSVNIFVRHSR